MISKGETESSKHFHETCKLFWEYIYKKDNTLEMGVTKIKTTRGTTQTIRHKNKSRGTIER